MKEEYLINFNKYLNNLTDDEKKIALEFYKKINNAENGIFFKIIDNNKNRIEKIFLILLTEHNVNNLKNCFLTNKKMIFFFENENNKKYTIERILNFEENLLYKSAIKIAITDVLLYFSAKEEESNKYFSFNRENNSLIKF